MDGFVANLLKDLTEPQRQAVTHTDGPLLVLAAAGSGKTRVITRRAAYIASTCTTPGHVLAITFTNKAAGEMKERIEAVGLASGMLVTTFHSLGARLLRWYAQQAGLEPQFSIFDESDARQIVRRAVEEAGCSTTHWSPNLVKSRISDAKNRLLSPNDFTRETADRGFEEQTIAKFYRIYQRMLQEANAVDFDDLLMRTAHLLGQHADVRSSLEARFRYVLIDEYQDTNHAQYMIARGLTLEHENICATGDPDQSIYGWRGADIRNILEFEQDYPKAQVVRLEQNYRSTQRILAVADGLIRSNTQRKAKGLWTENQQGPRVHVVDCESAEDEADCIVQKIQSLKAEGRRLGDIAVFYRVNSLSRVVEETFLRAGLSYQVARGTAFYNRKEIKDALAYLRILVNPADQIAFIRSVSTPSRGIGKTTIERLCGHANVTGTTIFEAARHVGEIPSIKTAAARAVSGYVKLIEDLLNHIDEPPEVVVERVVQTSGLLAEIAKQPESDDAVENVNELIAASADFSQMNPEGTVHDWLQQVALVSDVDNVADTTGAITLMTLHAAKGLEFPIVFIIGLEDGLLPYERPDEPRNTEEERRLLFVGITRAMEALTLTRAQWRRTRGFTLQTTRSMFIDELPAAHIECTDRTAAEPEFSSREDRQQPAVGDYRHWKPGMYLRHPAFGVGQLMWTQASGRHTRAGLRFAAYGEKTLILEFAKLQELDPDECQL
jgi:DNA helicase-2/ATP-dependent DNA helicase PcrA